jgi:hypothetical protein
MKEQNRMSVREVQDMVKQGLMRWDTAMECLRVKDEEKVVKLDQLYGFDRAGGENNQISNWRMMDYETFDKIHKFLTIPEIVQVTRKFLEESKRVYSIHFRNADNPQGCVDSTLSHQSVPFINNLFSDYAEYGESLEEVIKKLKKRTANVRNILIPRVQLISDDQPVDLEQQGVSYDGGWILQVDPTNRLNGQYFFSVNGVHDDEALRDQFVDRSVNVHGGGDDFIQYEGGRLHIHDGTARLEGDEYGTKEFGTDRFLETITEPRYDSHFFERMRYLEQNEQ